MSVLYSYDVIMFALMNDDDSVVEWLNSRVYDQHGLSSKPTRAILLCLGKTLYGTSACLVVPASSSKLQSYLY